MLHRPSVLSWLLLAVQARRHARALFTSHRVHKALPGWELEAELMRSRPASGAGRRALRGDAGHKQRVRQAGTEPPLGRIVSLLRWEGDVEKQVVRKARKDL